MRQVRRVRLQVNEWRSWIPLLGAIAWWDFMAVKGKGHPTLSDLVRRWPNPLKWGIIVWLWSHFIRVKAPLRVTP